MWLPDFFYSKTFKIIATVIFTVMNRDAGTKRIGEQTIAWSILTVFMKRR